MKDRIRQIMDNENMSATEFADKLQVSRAVISHILNGRNNPSLDVVTKILQEMPHVNSDWLINENGKMYRTDYIPSSQIEKKDLFNQESVHLPNDHDLSEKTQDSTVKPSELERKPIDYKMVIPSEKPVKKISQIIIYYDDKTFEKFIPESTNR